MINIENDNKASGNEDYDSSEPLVIINCLLNAALIPVAILGNALVLVAIIRTPSIRSTSMLMLCSLAVSDLLVGTIVQPFYIANHLTKGQLLFLLEGTIGHSVCGVSFLTITAITVDRFIALHYHLRYATLVTKSRVKHTLASIWVFSFALLGFYLWNTRVHRALLGVIIVICFVVSTFCYIRIYQILRHHLAEIRTQQRAVQSFNTRNHHTHTARFEKSVTSTFVFYIALLLCYIPMYIFLTLRGPLSMDWRQEWNFSATLVFSNSAINPFLYRWRIRELRLAVDKTARLLLCKKPEDG